MCVYCFFWVQHVFIFLHSIFKTTADDGLIRTQNLAQTRNLSKRHRRTTTKKISPNGNKQNNLKWQCKSEYARKKSLFCQNLTKTWACTTLAYCKWNTFLQSQWIIRWGEKNADENNNKNGINNKILRLQYTKINLPAVGIALTHTRRPLTIDHHPLTYSLILNSCRFCSCCCDFFFHRSLTDCFVLFSRTFHVFACSSASEQANGWNLHVSLCDHHSWTHKTYQGIQLRDAVGLHRSCIQMYVRHFIYWTTSSQTPFFLPPNGISHIARSPIYSFFLNFQILFSISCMTIVRCARVCLFVYAQARAHACAGVCVGLIFAYSAANNYVLSLSECATHYCVYIHLYHGCSFVVFLLLLLLQLPPPLPLLLVLLLLLFFGGDGSFDFFIASLHMDSYFYHHLKFLVTLLDKANEKKTQK